MGFYHNTNVMIHALQEMHMKLFPKIALRHFYKQMDGLELTAKIYICNWNIVESGVKHHNPNHHSLVSKVKPALKGTSI
jgi:hypothetical protein